MSSNELFSDEPGRPETGQTSTTPRRPSGRKLGVKGIGRLLFGLVLLIGTFAGVTAETLLTSTTAGAATGTYACTTPATGGTAVTFTTGVANTQSIVCTGTSGVSGTTAYPASITLNTGSLPPGTTEGTSTTSTPACATSTSGSGTTEKYILTCPISDTPATSDIGSYPVTFTANPGTDGGTATNSGTDTITVSNSTQTCIAPASGGTAQKFDEGYTNTYTVQCENETHVSGQVQYPSSIALTSGTGPADAPVTFSTSTSSSPACTQTTSGSGTTEQYILNCALSFAPTTSDAGGSYPFTFTPTTNGVVGPTSGALTITVGTPTLTCTAPAAAGTATTFNSSAAGTNNTFNVVCNGVSGLTGLATYPTSIVPTTPAGLPADLVSATSTSSTPACTRSTSGSGATETYILTCPQTESAVAADNGTYSSTYTASDSVSGATATSGAWNLTVTGPSDVCTAPAAGGTATTFKAGIANSFSVACYGTGFASADPGNYPSAITVATGSLPTDATFQSVGGTPACTTSTSGSGLTEHYIDTCNVTETPTAADLGSYPVTFSAAPGVNGGSPVTTGTWTLTVAAITPTCIDPASAGTAVNFYENVGDSYTVECEAQSGVSGTSAYPTSIAISTGSLPGDGNPTFATSTSSSPACTTATSGSGATEEYILECALADTPTSSDGGTYPLTFTATGPGGAGTATSGTLNVTVTPPTTTCTAPAAGGTSTSWTDGTAASFSVVCSSSGFASASPGNYPASITLNSGTLPSAATEATSTTSSPACTQSTSGSGVTEQYILTCPIADNPTFSQNGTYTDTFLATGGANGAPNATSGTWTLKVSQPAPSWATDGSTDGNYFSAMKGVPFCYDLEVSAGQVGPSGTNPGSTGSLPLTSLTAGTTPSGVTNYSLRDVNLAAGSAQICGTNNNNVASAPVIMAPVATNSGGTATDSIPLWSQNECTWSSSGATVSLFDANQDISQSGSQSAFGQPITNGVTGGTTVDKPACAGGVGVSASGGLGDAWTMNTANPLPTPTDTNPSAAAGDLPSSNLDLTSATSGAVGGCYGAVNILASTSTSAFGSSTASMTLPSTWVNGGDCSYGGLGSNSAGGNTDTPALSGPTGDASCPPTQEDVNAGLVDCTVVLSSGNDENGSTNYSSLDLFYNGQPVPQAPTASLSSSVVLPGGTVSVSGGSNWWGAPSGAPNTGPYGDFQNSASNFYPVSAPQVLIGTSRGTAIPVINPTVSIGAVTYACTGAETTTVGPNPCTVTVGQPTGSFQVPTGLAPGTYNIYIDETNTSPLPGNGPNDSYQTTLGTNLGTVESSTQLVIGSPPVITSGSSTAFTESSSGTFTVTTTGTPNAALSETGALPDGVSFVDNGDGTGTLSGTPAPGSAGSYPFTIAATNGESPDAFQSFTLTVNPGPTAPVITSDAETTFTQGSIGTFTVTSTGIPAAALSETGALPSGVTFTDNGDGTATLAGNPGVDGTFPITINATNGVSPDASQSFTLTVNPAPAAPVITSGSSTTFTEGSAGMFAVTSTGNPTAALSQSGALPDGVTFSDNGDGTATLAGTPTAGSAGSYPITIGATNGVSPDASQSFTLTVNPAPAAPVITSGSSASFTKGSAGTFTVTSTGVPTAALSETGSLPSGVTFTDNGDGTATLAGNPGAAGTFPITIHATNGVSPDASQSFTLTVHAAPAITSGSSTTFVVGTSGSFTVTSTGNPTPALSESGTLPSGVNFTDNGNGTAKLSGTPAAGSAGSYPITIGATNGVGAPAHQSFTLTITNAPAAPVITSASSTSFTAGTAGTFDVTATGNPAPTITESGTLPAGVTFSGGVLSGTATVTGSYPITFTATNGVGSPAHQSFTLTVLGFHVTTTSLPNLAEGTAYSQQLNATGGTTPYTWKKVGTLPKGLTLSSTGVLSGTVTVASKVAPGSYTVQVTVSDASPKSTKKTATASLTLIIQAPPAFTSATSAAFNEGSANSFTVTATGGPTPSITESGTLPTGVTFSGGVLSGTPTVAGSFPITFTASNGIGSPATQHFTLAIEGLRVTTTSLPPLTEGTPYSQQLTAADGIGTYKWAKGAALPQGLSLSGTGLLKGNVSAKNVTPGPYQIQVTVTDSTKHTVSATISLTINS
jgi:hypothetical protein